MADHWTRLRTHRAEQGEDRITGLFQADSGRARDFCASADDLVFDYSKTMIDATARDLLLDQISRTRTEPPR